MPRARRRRVVSVEVVLVLVLGLMAGALIAPVAHAKGGETGGRGVTYYLSNTFSTVADVTFVYGRAADRAYVGDWDGDGRDTLAVRRGATYYISNSTTGGAADVVVTYGRADDVALVGDWNGDGRDTLAVRRGATYYLKNSLTPGAADHVVVYGRAGDAVLVGDWNGDRSDTLAVRRGATYYLKNSISAGAADFTVVYGRATDAHLVGDWDGDGDASLGVRRGYHSSVAPIGPALAARMATSWRPGCPVPLADLRYLTMTYRGFDGADHRGEMVVSARVASQVVGVFERLYHAGFPIASMRLVDDFGGDDNASMAADNTSAFNCRAVTGGTRFSDHSYGEAIDINPVENPYVLGGTVLPPAGRAYLSRPNLPGVIHAGDVVVRAFGDIGWPWGGYWTSPIDYQHFSRSGR